MLESLYKEKHEELIQKLLQVEAKHIEFFENREPQFESDGNRDHLHNHWLLWTESHLVKFGFAQGSDLPENIRQECIKVFDEVFG
ncbi:MAG: hypothetical protein JXR65_13065 [Bacteroidales bacterium]|nr:hypothetical protein [Bacteroidales bacterium]